MKIQAEYKITTFRHWMLKDSWQKKKKWILIFPKLQLRDNYLVVAKGGRT
jgi:hypothetical protein